MSKKRKCTECGVNGTYTCSRGLTYRCKTHKKFGDQYSRKYHSTETRVYKYIQEHYHESCKQNVYFKCDNYPSHLEFDIVIYDGDEIVTVIELDGPSHFMPYFSYGSGKGTPSKFIKGMHRDILKTQHCHRHRINLLRISYTLFNQAEKEIDMFLGIVGQSETHILMTTPLLDYQCQQKMYEMLTYTGVSRTRGTNNEAYHINAIVPSVVVPFIEEKKCFNSFLLVTGLSDSDLRKGTHEFEDPCLLVRIFNYILLIRHWGFNPTLPLTVCQQQIQASEKCLQFYNDLCHSFPKSRKAVYKFKKVLKLHGLKSVFSFKTVIKEVDPTASHEAVKTVCKIVISKE